MEEPAWCFPTEPAVRVGMPKDPCEFTAKLHEVVTSCSSQLLFRRCPIFKQNPTAQPVPLPLVSLSPTAVAQLPRAPHQLHPLGSVSVSLGALPSLPSLQNGL